MSHSQFHSTNLFILRHAWLNLWDKHMTTGRINQVTTFHGLFSEPCTRYSELAKANPFLGGSSSLSDFQILAENRSPWGYLISWPRNETALFPDLTLSRTIASCLYNKNRGLPRELPATSKSNDCCSLDHGGFPTTLTANKLGHRQVVHISLLFTGTKYVYPTFCIRLCLTCGRSDHCQGSKVHSKPAYPARDLQKCMIDSVQNKPVYPFQQRQRHTLSRPHCIGSQHFNLYTEKLSVLRSLFQTLFTNFKSPLRQISSLLY